MEDGSASRVGPRFFKILLQEDIDQDQHMLIPMKFSNEHCYGLPSKVTLELPNGDSWLVQLVRDDERRVWFKKGWQQFSRHYSFQHGHFLLFELQGKSHFHVVVFGRSAAEIDDSRFAVDRSCPEEVAPGVGRMKKVGDPKGKAPAAEFAAGANIPTKQPSFSKVINKHFSSRGSPNFPLDFIRKYITKSSMELLQLRVGDRTWEVKLLAYDHHGYSIPSRGWIKFATDNKLNKGDICRFEVAAAKKTLNVHIQRLV
ncbi:unnamed protein product [Linum tenue]|uniref:TF-B3 domain-containing protein n=1 Tax=Linum tenue TaxID=586396 RepID=A0AAV0S810_9ROSI|nr:unnamed protein product [Linum tenue]